MSPDDSLNPFEAPAAPSYEAELSDDERTGPPWEKSEYSVATFIRTSLGVLFRPSKTFDEMRRHGRVSDALIYYAIGSFPYFLSFHFIYRRYLQEPGIPPDRTVRTIVLVFGSGLGLVTLLILAILLAVALHGSLIATRGSNRPLATTLRTVAYVFGSTFVWLLIPTLGPLLFLQSFFLLVIGLAKMHGVSIRRTSLAVFLTVAAAALVIAVGVVLIAGRTVQTTFDRVEPAIKVDR